MYSSEPNTLFLRLEGPLQAWGSGSKWVVRDTEAHPTKSGVIGLLCCALGRKRVEPVEDLAALAMGVRIDRPGELWRDYHTVGAKIGVMSAAGKVKKTASTGELETFVTQRFYLSDASFLVALMGEKNTIATIRDALQSPRWTPYLGRKSCPPSLPLYENEGYFEDITSALLSPPWHPRFEEFEAAPEALSCVVESQPDETGAFAISDEPLSFQPPCYSVRYVRRMELSGVETCEPIVTPAGRRKTSRMSYTSAHWKKIRDMRAASDNYLCVFCKTPSSPIHHISYENANNEKLEDLRAMCRLCHDAVSMLEAENNMGASRIDPLNPQWRDGILRKRDQIMRMRNVSRKKSKRRQKRRSK